MMLLASIRLPVKREINHIFHGSTAVSSTFFLGFLLLRISEIFDATCHFKKCWDFKTFLIEQNFYLDIVKTTFKYLRSHMFAIHL